jgi:hypothetical protein
MGGVVLRWDDNNTELTAESFLSYVRMAMAFVEHCQRFFLELFHELVH